MVFDGLRYYSHYSLVYCTALRSTAEMREEKKGKLQRLGLGVEVKVEGWIDMDGCDGMEWI